METKTIKTIADWVDAITAEMVRLDYKPTLVKQYHIVWSRLCEKLNQASHLCRIFFPRKSYAAF